MENKQEALNFAKNNRLGVVSGINEEKLYSSLVYILVEDDFSVYFITKQSSRKYEVFSKDARAAFVIGLQDSPVSVQLQGTIIELSLDEGGAVYLQQLLEVANSSSHWPTVMHMPGKEFAVFKFVPITGKFYDARETHSQDPKPKVFFTLDF